MSRPKPTVLIEHTDRKNGKCEQIIEGSSLFIVVYKNKPINIKSFNKLQDKCPSYKKTAFTSEAHAKNLAERLNKLFNTIDFTVKEFE